MIFKIPAKFRTVKVGLRTTARGAWRRAASSSGPRLMDAQRFGLGSAQVLAENWIFEKITSMN